ncbi:MAG: protein-tyrosine-phosphatase [Phycisphaerae bacterium]
MNIASVITATIMTTTAFAQPSVTLMPKLAEYVKQRASEFEQLDGARREILERVASYVVQQTEAGKSVRLTFICTHNSRRSHLGQVWARIAAEQHGIKVETYSGGTETTAFNPRAVATLTRAGATIDKTTEDDNPVYHVRYSDNRPPITCFSKVHNQSPNPKREHAAIMVCDEADQACPIVEGATVRIALPYVDPKKSDGTPAEAATYDERCAQIAREMMFVFDSAARQLKRPQ